MEKIEFKRFIERYLEGKMQLAECSWFEKELEGNKWLKKELDLRRKTDTIVGNSDAMDFRRKLQQAEMNHRTTMPVKRAITSSAAQYAALFIGIVIIASLLIISPGSSNSGINPDKLLTEFDPGTISRSAGTLSDNPYNRALDFYNSGDYSNAIIWFEKIVEDIKADFMIGVSWMNVSEYKEAIAPLQKVVNHNDNLYIEEASWRLAICYVETDVMDKAVPALEAIVNSNSKYNKKAKRTLRKIR